MILRECRRRRANTATPMVSNHNASLSLSLHTRACFSGSSAPLDEDGAGFLGPGRWIKDIHKRVITGSAVSIQQAHLRRDTWPGPVQPRKASICYGDIRKLGWVCPKMMSHLVVHCRKHIVPTQSDENRPLSEFLPCRDDLSPFCLARIKQMLRLFFKRRQANSPSQPPSS